MIIFENVTKSFDEIKAVDKVNLSMESGSVFGLIGTNGAGKSTLLSMLAGIIRPDNGQITIDGKEVDMKQGGNHKLYFIPDEPYFFRNGTAMDMEKYLSSVYEEFSPEEFYEYLEKFGLDKKRKISTFSKGMQKQLAILCGLCAHTKYLVCDETFDGLDPVMRQGIKAIFAAHMEQRGLTPIIASHNLRELEDICDHVGLLHKGGVILSKDLLDMKCNIQKIQCVFKDKQEEEKAYQRLELLQSEKRGMLTTLTVRGSREEILEKFQEWETLFFEILPLSLEEIFISETEVIGYDIKKLILN